MLVDFDGENDSCGRTISCLHSHSDGTHSLQVNKEFPQIFCDKENKLIYILNDLRVSTF